MPHVKAERIHAFARRGLDLRVKVTTEEDPADFTAIAFRVDDDIIEKTALTASATAKGFNVDTTITAAELNLESKKYTWELAAVFGGELRTLGWGGFYVSREPTTDT